MNEIAAYAKANGIEPTTVLQKSAGLGGGAWDKWLAGASCYMSTADKIRLYMSQNGVHKSERAE